MVNFDLIYDGAKFRWNDPAINDFDPEDREAQLNIEWVVFGVGDDYITDANDIVHLKREDGGEAEVLAGELRYTKESVKEIIAREVANMLINDVCNGCGVEQFVDWCEDGEIFGGDEDCVALMKEVAPTVDKLTYNYFNF